MVHLDSENVRVKLQLKCYNSSNPRILAIDFQNSPSKSATFSFLMFQTKDGRLEIVGDGDGATSPVVVNPDDVITGDGYERKVITINGQFPGPAIEVTEGAKVIREQCCVCAKPAHYQLAIVC